MTGTRSSDTELTKKMQNSGAAEEAGPLGGTSQQHQNAACGQTGANVLLKDVSALIRTNLVAVPSGFTKLGHPILYFPNVTSGTQTSSILESDLHLLFKYYLSVVPRTEQNSGFALIVDRRGHDWEVIRQLFHKVVTLFPARIKEAYLVHDDPPSSSPMATGLVSRLSSSLLLDFDLIHVDGEADLATHVETRYLPAGLGGSAGDADLEAWMRLQQRVEGFNLGARRIARRLAQFVGMLNQEEVNYRGDSLRAIATKNRINYRRLRKELEELTDHGMLMLKSLQRPDANVMQRLAVQVLCKQLDQAWTYFNRSWKMQDHVYVQYLELNTFQATFREVSAALNESERCITSLQASAASAEETNTALDGVDSCGQELSIRVAKARQLERMGQGLVSEHSFAADCVHPKCAEIDVMCQKLEVMLDDKRRLLHKFLDLFDSLEAVGKWCRTASQHLDREEQEILESPGLGHHSSSDEAMNTSNAFSQIRQLDYLLSKSGELRLRSRDDFEDNFEEIKELMSAQTLFSVDDAVEQLEAVTFRVMQRRDELRSRAIRSDRQHSESRSQQQQHASSRLQQQLSLTSAGDGAATRREKILHELITTEAKYVTDLSEVLTHYGERLLSASPEAASRALGNMAEVRQFHSECLCPELERCGANPAAVARVFVASCPRMKALYSSYCQNMDTARQAIQDLGGEASPMSLLYRCQQSAGHALPLSSYLLKPMQRLTKYQLLLRDLADSSNVVCGRPELEDALSELLAVIRVVNDGVANIRGLPSSVRPLGALNCQDVFTVTTSSGQQNAHGSSAIFARNKSQRRQVFLYDNHLVFCKPISGGGSNGLIVSSSSSSSSEKQQQTQKFQFKFSIATGCMGMSSVVRGDDRKIEVWTNNGSYVLEAKAKKAKENFAAELRKAILRQKNAGGRCNNENNNQLLLSANHSFCDTSSGGTSSSGAAASAANASRLARSRSCDSARAAARHLRSRSLGAHDSPLSEDEDDARRGDLFLALADYVALTSRELHLSEDDAVELVKVGCAGWWYVRLVEYPYQEGWAPSTYLEKVSENN